MTTTTAGGSSRRGGQHDVTLFTLSWVGQWGARAARHMKNSTMRSLNSSAHQSLSADLEPTASAVAGRRRVVCLLLRGWGVYSSVCFWRVEPLGGRHLSPISSSIVIFYDSQMNPLDRRMVAGAGAVATNRSVGLIRNYKPMAGPPRA